MLVLWSTLGLSLNIVELAGECGPSSFRGRGSIIRYLMHSPEFFYKPIIYPCNEFLKRFSFVFIHTIVLLTQSQEACSDNPAPLNPLTRRRIRQIQASQSKNNIS